MPALSAFKASRREGKLLTITPAFNKANLIAVLLTALTVSSSALHGLMYCLLSCCHIELYNCLPLPTGCFAHSCEAAHFPRKRFAAAFHADHVSNNCRSVELLCLVCQYCQPVVVNFPCRHVEMMAVYNQHLLQSGTPVLRFKKPRFQHTPMADTPRSNASSTYDLEDSFVVQGIFQLLHAIYAA